MGEAGYDWELAARKQWATSPNIRELPEDYPIVEDSPVSPLMFNGVGGSMILYAGAWPRALPSDFRVRSLDGVADDGEGGTAPEQDDVNADIENIIGGQGNDSLVGSARTNIIIGGNGADSIHGGAGTDTVSYAPVGGAITALLPVALPSASQ